MIAEFNFAKTYPNNSARHLNQTTRGSVLSPIPIEFSLNGGVYSSGTESSSEDSIPEKQRRKTKTKLKRVKSKTMEQQKKSKNPHAQSLSDSRSLSRDAEQDGKESHAKPRPTLDKISKLEEIVERLATENRTLQLEKEAALRQS